MKNIKTKDVITLIVATIVIVGAVFAIFMLLNPKSNTPASQKSTTSATENLSSTIDQNTYNKINSLSDYGKPSLTGIGKTDLFAN